jgi:hypothetical protein
VEYSSLRAIVVRENWLGCTGLSAATALMRADVAVQSLVETEFVPNWKSLPMRLVSKMLRKQEIQELNSELVRLGEAFRPHLVLIVKGSMVEAASIRKLKQTGACCICFYPDGSMMAHGSYIPRAIPEYDWIFTTKSFGPRDMKELFSVTRCSYLPHAADPEVHRPRRPSDSEEEARYGCDVSFIGGWSPDKEALLTRIAEALPKLSIKIWGARWRNVSDSSILAPMIRHEEIFGPSYALGIGGSRINLGLLQDRMKGASSRDLITSRTFHIPSCGGFMLHERTTDLAQVFDEGTECAAFESGAEAVEEIRRYLKDDDGRRRIAEEGKKRVEREHRWDHRVRTILDQYFLLQSGKKAACAAL